MVPGRLKSPRKPGGRIVIISTRWHEDDLCGRLLAEQDRGGDVWETLVLPAIAEENDPLGRRPGEFLWSDDPNYDYSGFLRQQLATQPPMNWAAMYQQRPAPETGDFFRVEWLKPYDLPLNTRNLKTYAASDYAVTSKGGDYTIHIICGIDAANKLYVLDLWRGQTTPDVWVDKMLDLAKQWSPISWAEEAGQIRASVGPLHRSPDGRAQDPALSADVPDATRQGGAGAGHSRPHVAHRALRADQGDLVSGLRAGIIDVPRRQA